MFEWIGRLHPMLVHLPIGILMLAIVFEWLPSGKKFKSLKRSINSILSIGAIAAIFSCITGYLLSQSGDYESQLIGWHQWMGITLAIYSLGYALMRNEKGYKSFHKSFALVLFILLTITGHLGGSLTHGEGYLTAGITSGASVDLAQVNLQEALFYDDLVQPILEDKCYSCHGTAKQKGKLRLDDPQRILQGGKDGVILIAGNVGESEMINRLLLPLDDEDHMPPKEKKQLNEKEIEILKTWIASGADFKKSVRDGGQLATLEKIMGSEKSASRTDVPDEETEAADNAVIAGLQKLGVVIIPVATNSNYLSANLINTTSMDSAISLLVSVKDQLIWLKTGDQPVTDNHLKPIGALTKLTKLSLDHAQITDDGLTNLKSLNALNYLNLNNTKISVAGISHLASLKLQSLFLYGTNIKAEELVNVKKILPTTAIELGNLQVPLLASDTTEAKAPPSK